MINKDTLFVKPIKWITQRLKLNISDEKIYELARFVKFCLVGVLNTAVSYVTYAILVKLNVYYIVSSIIAFFVSTTHAFVWNRFFVFQGNNKWWLELLKTYCSYGITGVLLYNALLYLFTDIMHLSPYISPFPVLLFTIPLNFLLNRFWTFRNKKAEAVSDAECENEAFDGDEQ
jgi:putative flippase GtrA